MSEIDAGNMHNISNVNQANAVTINLYIHTEKYMKCGRQFTGKLHIIVLKISVHPCNVTVQGVTSLTLSGLILSYSLRTYITRSWMFSKVRGGRSP